MKRRRPYERARVPGSRRDYKPCVYCRGAIPRERLVHVTCSTICAVRYLELEDLELELWFNPAFSFSNQVG